MRDGEKFMDEQRAPQVKTPEKKKFMDGAENTNFTAAADRITPYDPDELDVEKDNI